MKIHKAMALGCAAVAALAGSTFAQTPLLPNNLVVVRVGSGGAALTTSAAQVSLLEVGTGLAGASTSGTVRQTINLPNAGSGTKLQLGGSSSTEGYLGGALGGNVFALGGYDTLSSGGSNANTITSRSSALLDWTTGAVSFSSYNGSSGQAQRSQTTDGTTVWNGTSTNVSTTGGTAIQTGNFRNANIFKNNLYVSTGSATSPLAIGIMRFSGLPTAAASSTSFIATGGTGTGTASPYDFTFADDNTAYIADDRTIANGGGLQKWTFSAGSWTLAYTLTTNLTSGLRGVGLGRDGSGNAVIYATDALSSNNGLWAVTDTGSTSAFTKLADAGTNRVFRGVELVPTPGAATLMGLGLIAAGRRRR
jgi:hypothetical protein